MSNTASSTTKHTPTPWHANLQKDGWFDIQDGADANTANVLCTRFAWVERKEEMHANAAFIVRACNSHEQLVAALRSGHKAIDQLLARVIKLDPTFMPSQSPSWLALMAINEALSAAGSV